MQVTPHMLLIVCPLVFLAGFVDSIGGGGGLISLPAYLFAASAPHSPGHKQAVFLHRNHCIRHPAFQIYGSAPGRCLRDLLHPGILGRLLPGTAGQRRAGALYAVAGSARSGYYVLRKKDLNVTEKEPLSRRNTFLVSMPASMLIGLYDGFYGPGTGTFLILVYTGLSRLDLLTASANTKAVNLASNLGALTVFLLNGKVCLPLGLPAAAAAWPGTSSAPAWS